MSTADSDCLFCKIIAGDLPSEQVYSDERVVAFRDIAPRAPVHVLVVPRAHIASAHELDRSHDDLVTHLLAVTRQVAEDEGVTDGYRIATNTGTKGGQMVPHLHFHVLGGRQLGHIDSEDYQP